LGDFDQSSIAGEVTEGIIDLLEAVDIDKQHGRRISVAFDTSNQPFKVLDEAPAVREINEGIAKGKRIELVNFHFEVGDLSAQAHNLVNQDLRILQADLRRLVSGNEAHYFAPGYELY
jgi:hypothetical protein